MAVFGGSSPRVRGTGHGVMHAVRSARFIPACAGNSKNVDTIAIMCPVHPRVCGEQCALSSSRVASGGSSPRVRGTVKVE